MVERQDIDALLISALYGELTPADETRLASHLESHPADRTALADLTRAREVVRESGIFELQLQREPRQSITAVLLQEAARRAPRPVASSGQGWFEQLTRSFMAHPALAAAAMLVVVIGFATLISTRKGDQFAESRATSSTVPTPERDPAADGAGIKREAETLNADLNTPNRETGAAMLGADRAALASDVGVQSGSGVGAREGSEDVYRVGLDDAFAAPKGSAALEKKNRIKDAPAAADPIAKRDQAPTKRASGYVDLRKPEPAPRELGADKLKAIPSQAFEQDAANGPSIASDNSETITGRQGAIGSPGTAAGVGGGKAKAPAKAPSREDITRATVAGAAQTPSPSSPPPPAVRVPVATTRDARASGEKTVAPSVPADGKSDPQLAWATVQHKRVSSLVRDNNCQDAANLALEIARRAPSYYQQNVATDRELKKCLAYINGEREKDAERAERSKPSKRAVEQPAKAADRPASSDAAK